MRPLLGPLVAHALLFIAGLGLLRAFGVTSLRAPRGVLAAGGLAYLVGVATVAQICVVLLVCGVGFSLVTVGIVSGVLALPLLLDLRPPERVRRAVPAVPAETSVERWVAVAALAGIATVFIFGLPAVGLQALPYDAWNLWVRRADLLTVGNHLPLDVFQGLAYNSGGANVHPDYPIVLPLFEAIHLRAVGTGDPSGVQVALWLLWGAFVWAASFLASRVVRPFVWGLLIPAAALVVVGPLSTAYADTPLALFACVGVLSLGLWFETGRRQELALAVVLLGATAGIKNEGLVVAASAFLVMLALVVVRRDWRRTRPLVVAATVWVLLAVLPWRIWISIHDLKGDIPVGKALDLAFLADRFDRVWPSIVALHAEMTNRTNVAIFISFAIALAILRLRPSRQSSLAVFYLAVGFLYFAGLVMTYWISPLDLTFHVGGSVGRVSLALHFIALAAVLQLSGSAPRQLEPEVPAAAGDQDETVHRSLASRSP